MGGGFGVVEKRMYWYDNTKLIDTTSASFFYLASHFGVSKLFINGSREENRGSVEHNWRDKGFAWEFLAKQRIGGSDKSRRGEINQIHS